MELLERYLQAVRGYLLRGRRDDIVKELGDNILSQMEDQAADLGRPLTEAEQGEILKQHGHPLLAAARYQRLPSQYLIGPTLFPLYWYALQAVLLLVAAFHIMLGLVQIVTIRPAVGALVTTWGSFWLWILAGVGGVTICFGLIEYFGKGKVPLTDEFNPRELPPLKKAVPRRNNSLAELILGPLFVIGWLIFMHAPAPAFARALPVRLAPVWWRFEVPMLLAVALSVAAAFVHLFRPQFPLLRTLLRLASDTVGVVTFYLFLGTSEFIVISQGAAGRLADPVTIGNHVLTTGQLANYAVGLAPCIALISFFVDGLMEAVRLIRRKRLPAVVAHELKGIL
jgi:hypothetical protein